jgi:P4 family phage/plasmid primase-like protien
LTEPIDFNQALVASKAGLTPEIRPALFARGDHVELAETLVRALGGASDVVGDEGALWRYDDTLGIYREVTRSRQSCLVQAYAGTPIGERRYPLKVKHPDVLGASRLAYDQVAQPGFFEAAEKGVAFADGFAVVSEKGVVLRPHAREHRARLTHPFPYPGNVPAMGHLKFLEALFRGDPDKHEKSALWQEFGGACLLGIATTYQRCIVGLGGGCNGKSAAADILRGVMPEGSTSAVPPQEFEQEYRRALLAGKRFNSVSELPEAEILHSESFKAVVSGDAITGRHIQQAPFTFRPTAGHLFAANHLPGTRDQTHGFWRRFLVLCFNRDFTGDPERNPHIADEILAAERPAIVAWLLEGAARLMRQRDYTVPPSHDAALAEWRRTADSVLLFVHAVTEPCLVSEGTAAAALYAKFRAWSEQNGHRPMSSTKFGTRMKDHGLGAQHERGGNVYPLRVKAREGL